MLLIVVAVVRRLTYFGASLDGQPFLYSDRKCVKAARRKTGREERRYLTDPREYGANLLTCGAAADRLGMPIHFAVETLPMPTISPGRLTGRQSYGVPAHYPHGPYRRAFDIAEAAANKHDIPAIVLLDLRGVPGRKAADPTLPGDALVTGLHIRANADPKDQIPGRALDRGDAEAPRTEEARGAVATGGGRVSPRSL